MGVRNSGSSSQVSQGSRPLDDLLWHTAVFILMPCKYVSLLILHLYSCPHASVFTHSFCTLTCISTLGGVICKEKNLYPQPGFFNLSTGYLLPSWVGAERSCPTCYGMLNSIPGLYPLDVSGPCSAVTTKNVPRHCQMFPRGPKLHPRS